MLPILASLEDYEEVTTKVRQFLREGRLTGARRPFVAAVLNVESGPLCTGDEEDGKLGELYGPFYAGMQILAA